MDEVWLTFELLPPGPASAGPGAPIILRGVRVVVRECSQVLLLPGDDLGNSVSQVHRAQSALVTVPRRGPTSGPVSPGAGMAAAPALDLRAGRVFNTAASKTGFRAHPQHILIKNCPL